MPTFTIEEGNRVEELLKTALSYLTDAHRHPDVWRWRDDPRRSEWAAACVCRALVAFYECGYDRIVSELSRGDYSKNPEASDSLNKVRAMCEAKFPAEAKVQK